MTSTQVERYPGQTVPRLNSTQPSVYVSRSIDLSIDPSIYIILAGAYTTVSRIYLSIYHYVCPAVCLSGFSCLSVHLPVNPFNHLSIYLSRSIYLSIHLSIVYRRARRRLCPAFIHRSIFLPIHLSVYLSLAVCLSIYSSIDSTIYLSISIDVSIHLSILYRRARRRLCPASIHLYIFLSIYLYV